MRFEGDSGRRRISWIGRGAGKAANHLAAWIGRPDVFSINISGIEDAGILETMLEREDTGGLPISKMPEKHAHRRL